MNLYLRISLLLLFIVGTGLAILELAQITNYPIAQLAYGPGVHQVRAEEFLPTPPLALRGLLVPILMYHHIGEVPVNADSTRRDLTVSMKDFTAQVQWLEQQNYHSVSLEQVYQASRGQFLLPSKPIVFTFDDGYVDAFNNAPAVLHAHGFMGSFAIITHYVGQPDYATWDEIRAAQKLGMEMVSHTQDHFDGSSPKYNFDFIKQNLIGSRQDLAQELGSPPHILIYPYGHFTNDYVKAANEAGFDMALTVAFGNHVDPSDMMHIPRVRVHGNETLERFIEVLIGAKQTPRIAINHDNL